MKTKTFYSFAFKNAAYPVFGVLNTTFLRLIVHIGLLGALLYPTLLFAETKKDNPFKGLENKTIRNINIEVRDIFDDPNQGSIYKTVNSLKMSTREQIIRREILFKEGDSFDAFRVSETERVLRGLRYVRNVEVIPHVDGDFVDLLVRVQDTWTLIPKLGYSTGAGRDKKTLTLAESDLLGYGKRAEIGYQEDDGRRSWQSVWEDPRLAGTKQRLAAAYLQRTDGEQAYFSLDRPFRSFFDKSSWALDGSSGDTIGRLFKDSDEYYIYRQKIIDLSASYTISRSTNPEEDVSRYSFGWGLKDERFSEAKLKDYENLDLDPDTMSQDPGLLATNRRFSGPVLGFSYVEPDFITARYIDKFDRTEDYNLGDSFSTRFFFAPKLSGSKEDAILMMGNYGRGWRGSTEGVFTRGELGVSTRLQSAEGLVNSLFRTQMTHYKVYEPFFAGDLYLGRHTIASGFSMDYGWDLDKDRQLTLGADNGLRGYAARTLNGDKRLILNIEDRVHLAEDILKLFSVGAAVFADLGSASYNSLGNMLSDQLYSDVGIGFRVAFPRSSGGQVIRFDAAFPTRDGPDGSRTFEIRVLFAGGQIFNSHLASEKLGSQAANAEVGFDR